MGWSRQLAAVYGVAQSRAASCSGCDLIARHIAMTTSSRSLMISTNDRGLASNTAAEPQQRFHIGPMLREVGDNPLGDGCLAAVLAIGDLGRWGHSASLRRQ